MKKILLFAFITLFSDAFAQIEGDWYGFYNKNNKTTAEIVLHISKIENNYSVRVDFSADNKIGLVAEQTLVSLNEVFFILANQKIALEAKFSEKENEIKGFLVQNGRPQAIVFSHKKTESFVPNTANNQTNNQENASIASAGLAPDVNAKRPIAAHNSLFIEELTWFEVRDAIQSGKNSVIVATGGVEQSGPYIPTGKHNYVLRVTTEAIAKKLGNALIAPIVPFVPEGNHNPPTSHMKYPGTISLTESTYQQLIKEIVISYKVGGFKNIILIGDSGGNQWGLYLVAHDLNNLFKNEGVKVVYIYDYYDNSRIEKWLRQNGINEVSEGIHDSFKVTAEIALLNPNLIRKDQRIAANLFSINGIPLAPIEKTIEIAKKLVDFQTDYTVNAIKKKLTP